jgi:hypothetical protein
LPSVSFGTCFVIQPFDANSSRRYDDVFQLAIRNAGLQPYRVDRDPQVSIPSLGIEAGIRGAAACLADITTDNPNVWFEIGFASALGKPLVLVSDKSRLRFPFDVQHRAIVTYDTMASSEYEQAREAITGRLISRHLQQTSFDRSAGSDEPSPF